MAKNNKNNLSVNNKSVTRVVFHAGNYIYNKKKEEKVNKE